MSVTIITGDALTELRTLKSGSAHCLVTSPPYYRKRDYGTGKWIGGDAACDHLAPLPGGFRSSGLGNYANGLTAETIAAKVTQRQQQYRSACGKCGALRHDSQIGLERSPAEYLDVLVGVFAESRRVLRDDGVAWINMGDGYCTSPRGNREGDISSSGLTNPQRQDKLWGKHKYRAQDREPRARFLPGMKHKDLIGMPWQLAFALRADGWYLRSEVIWHKTNPMPESVDDRPTITHEHLFLFSKSADYYYDADAIAEPVSPNTYARLSQDVANQVGSDRANGGTKSNGPMKAVGRKTGTRAQGIKSNEDFHDATCLPVTHRNKRTVWTTSTEGFDGEFCTACRRYFEGAELPRAKIIERDGRKVRVRHCTCGSSEHWLSHFATFPQALIEPAILAGCPIGGTVLDPFIGAGTTGRVAARLQRNCIGVELNPDYADMARLRIARDAPLFSRERAGQGTPLFPHDILQAAE